MDDIIQLFQRHFSPKKLQEYRLEWEDITKMITFLFYSDNSAANMLQRTTVASSCINISTETLNESVLSYEVKIIPSGSNVEGANLARLFYEGNQREVEIDVMYQVFQTNKIDCLELCDKNNPMFVHFLVGNSKKSSGFLKSEVKCFLNKSPNFLKHVSGYPSHVQCSDWNPKDVARTFNMVISKDSEYIDERGGSPKGFEKDLINILLNSSCNFEQPANDMLQKIKQIQDDFLASRSKIEQLKLAIDWSNQCILLTNFLCDFRLETIGFALTKIVGLESKEMIENGINPLKKKFLNYLSIFSTLLNKPESDKTKKNLLDFEIDLKTLQCQVCLDMFIQQSLSFIKIINIASKVTEDNLSNVLEHVSRLSIDLVLCIKCNFWPEVAAEWLKRERKWPEQDIIKNIVKNGIHIVGKELRHSAIDWRLSFSVAEIEITKQWTPWQHYVHFIFKSLFYKYLKHLSKEIKVITSYLVKTVMLNVSESFPQSWWCEDNAEFFLNVLLTTLLSAFESKSLPHHFVTTFNLLEKALYDEKAGRVLNTAKDISNWLLLKPEEVVSNLSASLKTVEELINVIKTQTAMKNRLNFILLPHIFLCLYPYSCYDFNKWK